MDDHGGVTVVAHEDPVAAGAHDVVGVAAAVEEEDGLFFLLESLAKVVFEGGGEDVEAAAFFFLGFHVDGDDAGHLGVEGALGCANLPALWELILPSAIWKRRGILRWCG